MGQPVRPAVLNAGQVIFFRPSTLEETGAGRFADAAVPGGHILVDNRDDDVCGAAAARVFSGENTTLFNARTAPPLAEAAERLKRSAFRAATARAFGRRSRTSTPERADARLLLGRSRSTLPPHTGTRRAGSAGGRRVLEDSRLMAMAERAAQAPVSKVRADGWMPGRFAFDWSGESTGRPGGEHLDEPSSDHGRQTMDGARPTAFRSLKSMQEQRGTSIGKGGSIQCSMPFGGSYGSFQLWSWATTFFGRCPDKTPRHPKRVGLTCGGVPPVMMASG